MSKSFDISKMMNISQNRIYIMISLLLCAVILLVLFAGQKKVQKRRERFTNDDGLNESQKIIVDKVVSGQITNDELAKQIREGDLTQEDLNSIISYVAKMSDKKTPDKKTSVDDSLTSSTIPPVSSSSDVSTTS